MPMLRACLASLVVPMHEATATVPQQFKDIFGVTEDLPEVTTTTQVQNWEDLTPEEREAAKDGLINVAGAPADVVATAKHIMQEKARKEQASAEDDFEGNPEENDEDEEESPRGATPLAKAHSMKQASQDSLEASPMHALANTVKAAEDSLEASPMHALASTVQAAEKDDESDSTAMESGDNALPASADPQRTGSLRGAASAAAAPEWPDAFDATVETTTHAPSAVVSVTTTATTAAMASTAAASGGFDVNSIARLHTMLEAAKAGPEPEEPVQVHSHARAGEEDEQDEDRDDGDFDDYDASVQAASRKKVGLVAAAALQP